MLEPWKQLALAGRQTFLGMLETSFEAKMQRARKMIHKTTLYCYFSAMMLCVLAIGTLNIQIHNIANDVDFRPI